MEVVTLPEDLEKLTTVSNMLCGNSGVVDLLAYD